MGRLEAKTDHHRANPKSEDVSPRARYLLLGDWGRVVRDPIDLLRASFVVGAVLLFVLGNDQWLRMVATAGLVVFARFADVPRPFDLGLCLGLGLQAWGKAFDLYEGVPWYDVAVHFGLPLLVSPLAYITLARLHVVPDLKEEVEAHHYVGVFLVTFCVMVAFGGALWEVYEYVADMLLDTNMYKGPADSIGDMVATACGAALGGVLLVLWAQRGWGTTRRAPAPHAVPAGHEPSPGSKTI